VQRKARKSPTFGSVQKKEKSPTFWMLDLVRKSWAFPALVKLKIQTKNPTFLDASFSLEKLGF